MKAAHSTVAKTTITSDWIEVAVQPEGTDIGYDQLTVHLTPTKDGIYLHFCGMGSKKLELKQLAANSVDINFV